MPKTRNTTKKTTTNKKRGGEPKKALSGKIKHSISFDTQLKKFLTYFIAYMYFCQDKRDQLKKDHPKLKFGQIGKVTKKKFFYSVIKFQQKMIIQSLYFQKETRIDVEKHGRR
jgi:hypothetical protein